MIQLKQSEGTELSSYARFVLNNQGFQFFNRKTGKEIYKYVIWAKSEKDDSLLNSIYLGKNFLYERKERK
jgi:hypothetical protein